MPPGAAGARGGDARVRRHVFRRGRGEREEVRTGVAGGQGGGGGRGVDGQAGWGAVVQRVLGEGAQVPGGVAVVRSDAFAPLQPGQGAVQ